jgi:hypothetical protein
MAGGDDDGGDPVAPVALASATHSPTADDEPAPSVARPPAIVLDMPGRVGAVVDTAGVVIRGRVPDDAGRLQILLQTTADAPIVVVTAQPMSAARTGWPTSPSMFDVEVPLPEPRPIGPALIQIVSYDQRGRARDVLLRRIVIGERTRRPTLGEDGLVGGIVFGTSSEGARRP